MENNKNYRPLLLKIFIGIIGICLILFLISKITHRNTKPVPVTDNDNISKIELWNDENGSVASEIVYEEDQSVYKSSLLNEYKFSGLNPRITKISKNGWNLILLNKKNILPDNYDISLSEIAGSSVKADSDVAVFYNKMYIAASKEKIILTPVSGYRTVSYQRALFEKKVDEIISEKEVDEKIAVSEATKTVNIPASSEHNAGLSVDILSDNTDFANTKEYKWLLKNAENYGFILRYPKDKESITKVEFKPYHWRFVGINAAKEMNKKNLCLEEYLKSAK